MEIEVKLKRLYGKDRFYPESNDAKLLCKILDRPTITKEELKLAKEGGWSVLVKVEEYQLE